MAVGDDEVGVAASLPGRESDVPAAITLRIHGAAYGSLHAGPEVDPVAQPELLDVGTEVVLHQPVAGEVRPLLGHGEVLELQPGLGGVDVQRLVDGGPAVGVLEVPVAADVVGELELFVVDAEVSKALGRGDARAAGADDAHTRHAGHSRTCSSVSTGSTNMPLRSAQLVRRDRGRHVVADE